MDHGPIGVAATVPQKYVDEMSGEMVYRPVHHNSCVLTPTEERYREVEGESLAILAALSQIDCTCMAPSLRLLLTINPFSHYMIHQVDHLQFRLIDISPSY